MVGGAGGLQGIPGQELVEVTAGGRRCLTPSTFVLWPFMLFMEGDIFLNVGFLKYTDLEECSDLSFHSLYICSSPLFPAQCYWK